MTILTKRAKFISTILLVAASLAIARAFRDYRFFVAIGCTAIQRARVSMRCNRSQRCRLVLKRSYLLGVIRRILVNAERRSASCWA